MFKRIKQLYRSQVKLNQKQLVRMINSRLRSLKNYDIEKQKKEILSDIKLLTPYNPVLKGFKVYSQNDEDGIINDVFSKIENDKTFIEFGCGNGLENNTHWLLLNGWRGVWVDGATENIKFIAKNLKSLAFKNLLLVDHKFITIEILDELYNSYCSFLKVRSVDFISIDLDGIDYYVAEYLLAQMYHPKVFCVEYNSKFPPPADIKVKYDSKHVWEMDDYQGASLQAWVNIMAKYDYMLVACNISGTNAFFVKKEFVKTFVSYPIESLYQPSRSHFQEEVTGHFSSFKYLFNILHK